MALRATLDALMFRMGMSTGVQASKFVNGAAYSSGTTTLRGAMMSYDHNASQLVDGDTKQQRITKICRVINYIAVSFRLALTTAIIAAPFALAYPANSNVFATSPIQTIDRSKYPAFDAVGLLERNRDLAAQKKNHAAFVGSATGLYIAPCTVLTNYHVAFDQDRVPVKGKDYSLHFSVGYLAGKQFLTETDLQPVGRGDLEHLDFLLLHDPKCLGKKLGWYSLSPVSREALVEKRQTVGVLWTPGAGEKGKMRFSQGPAVSIDDVTGNVLFGASTVPGSSGGPVFIVYQGHLVLQGLNVGSKSEGLIEQHIMEGGSENRFLNTDSLTVDPAFESELKNDLKMNPCKNPLNARFAAEG